MSSIGIIIPFRIKFDPFNIQIASNNHNELLKTLSCTANKSVPRYTTFFLSNLGFCLELGLLNSETEIGTGVA